MTSTSPLSDEPSAPKHYHELAGWWPLLSSPDDYVEEAEFLAASFVKRVIQRTVLELSSGGGNNASHLKLRFHLTLVEPSDGMRQLSEGLNPECEHLPGDMRDVRLGREVDRVFMIHDAICCMSTAGDVHRVLETAFVHCRPGGAALFAPDHVCETYRDGVDDGGHEGAGRALRYLEWTWDPDPSDTMYIVDYACLLRDRRG